MSQKREQTMPMVPQVLAQPLVGRIRLGRETQIGYLVLQATAGHRQAVTADLSYRVTVTKVQASAEQLRYTTRKTQRSPCRRRHHLIGTP
jgi:hypothetical protein